MMHTHYYSRSAYHVYILLATLAETRMDYIFCHILLKDEPGLYNMEYDKIVFDRPRYYKH